MTDLAGKVAVVTGASRGLGAGVASRLAKHGATLVLVARSEASLAATAERIREAGGTAHVVAADLGQAASFETLRDTVAAVAGSPSILVNAAGTFGPIQLVRNTDPAAWIETIMVNLIGSYLTCRAFTGGMIDSGWGRVINVTSAAALHQPGPVNSAYGTSKAALNQFTRHLASELEASGVTANVIHPGDVKTDMWSDIATAAARLGPEAQAYKTWADWVEETGGDDPEKAADLVLDLVGDAAAAVNGQFLWIKNGLQPPIPSWGEVALDQPWRSR
jgi:NAD(P)-dependent dehydrogenase (short-subunit alcohol dehydrogenase family)